MSNENGKLRLDVDALTLGDLEDFEDGVGVSLHEALRQVPELDEDGKKVLDGNGRPKMTVNVSAKALRHLVWIVRRTENPEFTADDARNVKITELELVEDEDAADAEGNDGADESDTQN